MEAELFDALREKLSKAYARAGQQAVTGFWTVLEGFIPRMSAPGSRICGPTTAEADCFLADFPAHKGSWQAGG